MDKIYISQIAIGNSTYDIKDAEARSLITGISNSITGGMHYLGKSTTAIANGDATGPWTIDGVTYVVSNPAEGQKVLAAGDIAIYGELEFIWSGASGKWQEFGSTGSLKSLAFKDSATGSGSVSFSGGNSGQFVTGYAEDGEAPSKAADTFTTGTLPSKAADTWSAGTLPSKSADTWSAGTLPSLGTASTSSFNTDAMKASVNGEVLQIADASTATAVTAQGTFSAGTLPSFIEGEFTAGTLPSFTEGTFNAGTLPSFTEGAFDAGSLPTLAKSSAITSIGTGTASVTVS